MTYRTKINNAMILQSTLLLLYFLPLATADDLCSSCPCLSETTIATDTGGAYSCGARVTWVQANLVMDQRSACQRVSGEFPSLCVYAADICETSNNCGEAVVSVQSVSSQQQCPRLTWSDEFSGNALDTSKWAYQTGDGTEIGLPSGWGNNELEWYQPDNVKVSSGRLVIEARQENVGGKPYTSGRIRTKGLADFQYGRLEASIKIPYGNGIWPAFWLLPTNEVFGTWPKSGEIDIMEAIGKDPSTAFGTLHYGPAWPYNKHQGSAVELLGNEHFSDSFHEFAVDWSPGKISWSVDGASFLTLTSDVVSPWPFDEKFHFLLNVAVGGSWPGFPDATSSFPQIMQVDYVRVYDKSLGRLQGPMYVDAGARRIKFRIMDGLSDYSYQWSVPGGVSIVTRNSSVAKRIIVNWGSQSGYVKVTATSKSCGVTKTFSIPVKVVASNSSSAIRNCGCPQCTTSVLNRLAADFSCIDRMNFMVQSAAMDEDGACKYVTAEYPGVCGPECDPTKCKSERRIREHVASEDDVPLTRCAKQIATKCGCERLRKNRDCWASVVASQCDSNSLSDEDQQVLAELAVQKAKKVCNKLRSVTNRH
ncbi:hypothetical protein MPSEU_000726800 [Mayamaea pseudoterrestris]|nr:hypothetical protein MPSEU_000726800 [Mayamaea pseudoterrestris]